MPFRKKNPKKMILMAGLQGLVIGVVGVLLFGLLLNIANDRKVEGEASGDKNNTEKPATENGKETGGEKVETSAEPSLTFKAKQYGMFSTKESAISFMAVEPSLERAGIVQAEGQFYIWSDLYVKETAAVSTEALPSFIKNFYVSTSSCENPKVKNMMTLLTEENLSKNFFDSIASKEKYPDDLATIVQAITTFSDSPSVIRLHVFTHYLEQNDCVKLNF
ncbi:hypothetical protein [Psychrobacillus sp. MER TA 171]|uniref:hypothetical protein n=1 Tax=Psychrobacillus sp. MER TA 171 TaxID=2939577 RepID=UPI0020405234|nr:hypothetical protein [Psychrobacillus sp. MER TA 171]MCM3357824.1 hypothetical protein [Psychrobacillus sp. MER TA 171]